MQNWMRRATLIRSTALIVGIPEREICRMLEERVSEGTIERKKTGTADCAPVYYRIKQNNKAPSYC
jgi:hypothetical protein